jgi:hypothetical protein
MVFASSSEPTVVYKNYVTTTENGQYIQISDILNNLPFNSIKVETQFMTTTSVWSAAILATRGNRGVINLASGKLQVRSCGGDYNQVTPSKNTLYTVGFNLADGTSYIDENTYANTGTPSSSDIEFIKIFSNSEGGDSYAGRIKVGYVKIYNNNVLLCDLRPALVGTIPCLYDTINSVVYGEYNDGLLSVE